MTATNNTRNVVCGTYLSLVLLVIQITLMILLEGFLVRLTIGKSYCKSLFQHTLHNPRPLDTTGPASSLVCVHGFSRFGLGFLIPHCSLATMHLPTTYCDRLC